MAIHLITGVPGAGKSLRLVYQCCQRLASEKEQDRPVFGNIRGFRRQAPLPGSKFQHPDGRFEDISGEWMDVPDGSIILIDEVQERWRRYRTTGEPPPEIAALERHRHRNIDFILTCQNPKQLSDDVRSLVDVHEHLTKKSKNSATVYRWSGRCSTSPYTSRRDPDCEVSFWRYPKWVFDEYVSADEHTVNKNVPRIVKIAVGMALAIPIMFFVAYKQITGIFDQDESLSIAQNSAPNTPPPVTQIVDTPETVEETVEVVGVVIQGKKCRAYDSLGRVAFVPQDECFNVYESGPPRQLPVITF